MKLKEVTASFSYTMNVRPYESANFFQSRTATIEDGDDSAEVYKEILNDCKNLISAEVKRLRGGANKKTNG